MGPPSLARPALPARAARPPRADDERSRWREAERLGIAAEIARSRTRLAPEDEYRLAVAIVREAQRHGLDPRLVAAVIRVESSFDALAKSPRGALGLMQVMPRTGAWLAQRMNEPLASTDALLEYDRNVALGALYLADLVRQFGGRVEQALLAYNYGPAAARRILADASAADGALAGYPRKVLDEYARLTGAAVQTASREPAGEARSPVAGRRPVDSARATP